MDDLRLANRNATDFWRTLGRARGYELVERPKFLAALDPVRNGLRVVIRSPEADFAEVQALRESRSWPRVTIEDPYGVVSSRLDESGRLGAGRPLTPMRMPVMIRRPGALPAPSVDMVRVETVAELAEVDRVVVDGFPLAHLQPEGGALPPGLLDAPGVAAYLVMVDGRPAAACVTVGDDEVAGVYFVTTLPEFRGRGLARELMYAVLDDLRPMTLTAAEPAQHLYKSLGFRTVADSTWWSS